MTATRFALRPDTTEIVRFLDMPPEHPSHHHFIKHPSGHRWSVPDCDLEDCSYCEAGEKPFKRWPITVITGDFQICTWEMPLRMAVAVNEFYQRLGIDLFLSVDFEASRVGRGLDTYFSLIPMWGNRT